MKEYAVTLTEEEWKRAGRVGLDRNISSVLKGLTHRNGMDSADAYRAHIEGACGELAVAKMLGMQDYWHGEENIDTFRRKADVLGNIEVKTRSRHDYELLIRQYDMENLDGEKLFVHVTGTAPNFMIRGWLSSATLTEDPTRWWKTIINNRPPAWFVPVLDLSRDWGLFSQKVKPAACPA